MATYQANSYIPNMDIIKLDISSAPLKLMMYNHRSKTKNQDEDDELGLS